MSFRIQGLDPAPFAHLIGRPHTDLVALGVRRHVVDSFPGYPDRIGLRDCQPGETLLLLNFEHQPAATPYRAAHAIFIAERHGPSFDAIDTVPEVLQRRPISLRAFSAEGDMLDADLAPGTELAPLIERLFADPATAYLHAHYAKRGCYAARVLRA